MCTEVPCSSPGRASRGKEAILLHSVCPPGPHTLLVSIQENTCLFSVRESVVTLQCCSPMGDCLGDILNVLLNGCEGKALQWLVEKCKTR